jgi:cytidylate kinase
MVSVFVTGDMPEKKRRITERYDIEKTKAEDFIKKTDKRRANYYEYYTDRKWGAADNYDITVNSSRIGIDGAVEMICAYVELAEKYPK